MALNPDSTTEARRDAEAASANSLPPKGIIFSSQLDELYYLGQARAMGMNEPVDPNRIDGQKVPLAPHPLNPWDYKSDWEYNEAWRKYYASMPDGLASIEKHELAGAQFS